MNKTLCFSATVKLGDYDSVLLLLHGPLCVITVDFHKTRVKNTSPYYTATSQWGDLQCSFVHESCAETETSLIRFCQNDTSC